ncbi:hypothetical protein REH65_30285 [Saccharopolyspora sp. ID03-671]|uniref:hypothetical protein n=1 Tax=Saccharopolyspora sp. ID03-671 TaxID=3073066 RepID=UPI00324F292D
MSSRRTTGQLPHQTSHVYRNPCTGRWICDFEGTRAEPGPDSARTVCRTHREAVLVAVTTIPARAEV